MFVERFPVIIKDSEGEPKAAATGVAMTDDEGCTIVAFDGVTLENEETMCFTTTVPRQ